jgi:hypothetical protein
MSSSAETISSQSMPSSLDDDGRAQLLLVGENVLHQRGLAAAEKARDHGHGQARAPASTTFVNSETANKVLLT